MIFILSGISSPAQNWELIASYPLEATFRIASVDRLSNIYINDSGGNINKLDSLARPLAQYAPLEYGLLSSMETWSSLRVFLFYQDTQRYTFLDRFLSPNEFSGFPDTSFGLVSLAAPSSDNQIWLLDQRPLNLTKFDIKFNTITLSQSLNQLSDTLDLDPYQLLEYQNRVYLGNSKIGVLVFDNMGNYLHTIEKLGKEPFQFNNDQVYYLQSNHLHIKSIYHDQHHIIDLPDNGLTYRQVLMLTNSTALIADDRLDIYRYKP